MRIDDGMLYTPPLSRLTTHRNLATPHSPRLYRSKNQAWLTPVEIFAPHYSNAIARYGAVELIVYIQNHDIMS